MPAEPVVHPGGARLVVAAHGLFEDAGLDAQPVRQLTRARAERGNVLYFIPTQSLMDDFASSRFDRAIQDSPYLRMQLQPEPPRRKGADSKRLTQLGPGYIFKRGSDSSRRQGATVDADVVILDEYDQMADGTLELAIRRLASSARGLLRVASTPRYPETGVNGLFVQSDQRYYHLRCPACDLDQRLIWPDNIDFELALVVCSRCGEADGRPGPGTLDPHGAGVRVLKLLRGHESRRLARLDHLRDVRSRTVKAAEVVAADAEPSRPAHRPPALSCAVARRDEPSKPDRQVEAGSPEEDGFPNPAATKSSTTATIPLGGAHLSTEFMSPPTVLSLGRSADSRRFLPAD